MVATNHGRRSDDAPARARVLTNDLPTLLWQHTVLIMCAASAEYQAEWEHYTSKAARVGAAIAEHIVREEEDVGVVQGR